MSIDVACPDCGAKFAAPDRYAGQRAKCPQCQAPLQVPNLELGLADEPIENDDSQWLDGFETPASDHPGESRPSSPRLPGSSPRPSEGGPRGPRSSGGSSVKLSSVGAAGPLPINFACHACAQPMQAPPDLAGRVARCKHCGERLIIPAPLVSRPAPPRGGSAAEGRGHGV